MPSLVIAINPVYFTNQHDVINEGGMDNIIKSPVFLNMNHNGIMNFLNDDVKSIFSNIICTIFYSSPMNSKNIQRVFYILALNNQITKKL